MTIVSTEDEHEFVCVLSNRATSHDP